MIEQKIQQNDIDEFLRLVTPSLSGKIKAKSPSAPDPKNAYKVKGQKARTKAPRQFQAKPGFKEIQLSHKEHPIHVMIRDNPKLLHTPELYSGGLYLNAVINKPRLPCGLLPDFLYITVHNRVIRITLVEIEQAAHSVFDSRRLWRSEFVGGAKAGLDQVRSWQRKMLPKAQRETLLLNLRSLFDHYPIELFTPEGDINYLSQIEMGYVLIVGEEPIKTDQQQKLIDDLYLDENILFMTYPMMIDQVIKRPQLKNMLSIGPHGTKGITLQSPEILLTKGPYIGLARCPDNDPYGITTGALGWPLFGSERRERCQHPESLKQIFYRAGGECEYPDCNEKALVDGNIHGRLGLIYNYFQRGFDCNKLTDTDYTPWLCPKHYEVSRANHPHRAFDSEHPMRLPLQARKPYRPDLDADLSIFLAQWRNSISRPILELLEIDPLMEPELAGNIHHWMLAVISLPWDYSRFLSDLVWDHYRLILRYRLDRTEQMIIHSQKYRYLLNAGVIKVNPLAPPHLSIEPAIFNHAFVDRVKAKFPDQAALFLSAICRNDVRAFADRLKEYLPEKTIT